MSNVVSLLGKLERLDTKQVIVESLEEVMPDLEDMNRERMMDGIMSDGSEMPHYSIISQTVYGYPDIRITLKDTGDFQAGLKSQVQGDVIHTESRDYKHEKLVGRFGDNIYGTGGDYKAEFNTKSLLPAIVRNVKRKTTGV